MSNSRRGLTARQPVGRRRGRAGLNHLRAKTDADSEDDTAELAKLPRISGRCRAGKACGTVSTAPKTGRGGPKTSAMDPLGIGRT
jgi:hypothetical protein